MSNCQLCGKINDVLGLQAEVAVWKDGAEGCTAEVEMLQHELDLAHVDLEASRKSNSAGRERLKDALCQIEEFKAWQKRAMHIIAPVGDGFCTNNREPLTPRSCLDDGITGSSACLRCKAKHLRENPKVTPSKGGSE